MAPFIIYIYCVMKDEEKMLEIYPHLQNFENRVVQNHG